MIQFSSNVNVFADATAEVGTFTYRIYATNPNQKTDPSNPANILIADVEILPENMTYIYPNPADNMVTIKDNELTIGEASIQIRNSMGVLVVREKVVFARNGEIHFDVSEMPSGIYFIELQNRNSNRVMKLVKK